MLELHEPTFIFTAILFIAGVVYGQFMYRQGHQDGQDSLVKDLLSQDIIDLDDDGVIIRSGD